MESFKEKYDTILLAGDTGASRKVRGVNKSFLEINGVPLFLYVLKALEGAERVNRICLVGPKEKLDQAIGGHHNFLGNKKEVTILEQGESLYSNAWESFLYLCPEAREVASDKSAQLEKAVLCVSGDIPLVTPFEIDTFIDLCEVDKYDYFLGITRAESLRYFRKQRGKPGIKLNYFYLREGKYRQNNLHLIKPLKVKNRHYIQKVYDYRYQRDLSNIAKMAAEFLKLHVGLEGFWCYCLLHWNQLLSRINLDPLTLPTRRLLPLSFIESCISRVLGTCFVNVVSHSPGAVLDIDNVKDYKIVCKMFSLWQNYQHQREEILKEKQKHTQVSSLSRDDAA
jgi:GTP:adenosylcobinamide-phosphate guanylyltransferase